MYFILSFDDSWSTEMQMTWYCTNKREPSASTSKDGAHLYESFDEVAAAIKERIANFHRISEDGDIFLKWSITPFINEEEYKKWLERA